MKVMRVLGIVVLTSLLSISGTYMIMKRNDDNERSKSGDSEFVRGQTVSTKNDEKELFQQWIRILVGKILRIPRRLNGKVEMNHLLKSLEAG